MTIRGNLALALRLDGVDTPERPAHFPRARSVRAVDLETFYLAAGRGRAMLLGRILPDSVINSGFVSAARLPAVPSSTVHVGR